MKRETVTKHKPPKMFLQPNSQQFLFLAKKNKKKIFQTNYEWRFVYVS
jgi:hypothetical protein